MEAREEKLMRARASFRNEGSPKTFSEGGRGRIKAQEKESETAEKSFRGVSFGVRVLISIVLLALFVLADTSNNARITQISDKSFAKIQKNEINVEKYSALISKLW